MRTVSRGNSSEAAVLYALTAAGFPTLIPFGDGLAFDLAVVLPRTDEILRIQVKSGWLRGGCVCFNTCSTDHGRGRQAYHGRADVIAVYAPELPGLFMVPVDECPSYQGMLRLDAPRNNQRRGVRFADAYRFEKWTRAHSPLGSAEFDSAVLISAEAAAVT